MKLCWFLNPTMRTTLCRCVICTKWLHNCFMYTGCNIAKSTRKADRDAPRCGWCSCWNSTTSFKNRRPQQPIEKYHCYIEALWCVARFIDARNCKIARGWRLVSSVQFFFFSWLLTREESLWMCKDFSSKHTSVIVSAVALEAVGRVYMSVFVAYRVKIESVLLLMQTTYDPCPANNIRNSFLSYHTIWT